MRSIRTAELVTTKLSCPFNHVTATALDDEISPAGAALRLLLHWLFDAKITRREVLDAYFDGDQRSPLRRTVVEMLVGLQNTYFDEGMEGLRGATERFAGLVKLLTGNMVPDRCVRKLDAVLASEAAYRSYMPPRSDELQVMTIHKSKGLEFDVVFHLDMYQWVLPYPEGDVQQDVNLHYVALTRARKAVFMCCSTKRHNRRLRVLDAQHSSFYSLNGLHTLSSPSPF